jgi:leader peptidase (prepilin peptidase) / N-methyltransferase
MTLMIIGSVILGLIIGSFLNVCIFRLPRDMSIVFPGSFCTICKKRIRPWDNIPVISYIILRGKCRNCGEKISPRYPAVELLNGLLYAAVFLHFGPGWHLPILFIFVSAMIVITFIDLEFQIIPNGITLPGIILALAASQFVITDPFSPRSTLGVVESLTGCLSGGIAFHLIAVLGKKAYKVEAMGLGDVKMMAMVGAFTGWKGVFLTTLAGSLTGSLVGIGLMIFSGAGKKTQVPFGPFLALGSLITLFWGNIILDWFFPY